MSLLTIEHSLINARLKPTEPCGGSLISFPLVGEGLRMSNAHGIYAKLGYQDSNLKYGSQNPMPYHLAIPHCCDYSSNRSFSSASISNSRNCFAFFKS